MNKECFIDLDKEIKNEMLKAIDKRTKVTFYMVLTLFLLAIGKLGLFIGICLYNM